MAPGTMCTTLTYASLLNQVERWLGIITQRAMPWGSFLYV